MTSNCISWAPNVPRGLVCADMGHSVQVIGVDHHGFD